MPTILSTIYSFSRFSTKKCVPFSTLRVFSYLDGTQAVRLRFKDQNIFWTQWKKIKHQFRYFVYSCNFFDIFYEILHVFRREEAIFSTTVWNTELDSLNVTWEEHRVKNVLEKFRHTFLKKTVTFKNIPVR